MDSNGVFTQTWEVGMWPSSAATPRPAGFLPRNGGHLQLADFMWGPNNSLVIEGERWYGGGVIVDRDFNVIDVPDSRYPDQRINLENPMMRSTLQGETPQNIAIGGDKTLSGQAADTFRAIVLNIFGP